MRVKATTNLGTNDYPTCPLLEGEVGEVPDSLGEAMVANGHAVDVTPQVKAKLVANSEPAVVTPSAVTVANEPSTPDVSGVKHKPKGGK